MFTIYRFTYLPLCILLHKRLTRCFQTYCLNQTNNIIYLLVSLLSIIVTISSMVTLSWAEVHIENKKAQSNEANKLEHQNLPIQLLHNQDPQLRRAMVDGLVIQGDTKIISELIDLLSDVDPFVRQAAIRKLGALGDKNTTPYLFEMLGDTDIFVKLSAIRALGAIRDPKSLGFLADLLRLPDKRIKHCAAQALDKFNRPEEIKRIGNLFVQDLYSNDSAKYDRCNSLYILYGQDRTRSWLTTSSINFSKSIDNIILLRGERFRLAYPRLYDLGLISLRKMTNRPLVIEELINRMERAIVDYNYDQQILIATILVQLKDPLATSFFLKVLNDDKQYWSGLRGKACQFFAEVVDSRALPLLRAVILDPLTGDCLKTKAISGYQEIADPEVESNLLADVDNMHKPEELRQAAIDALAAVETKGLIESLVVLIKTKRERWLLQAHCLEVLGKMQDPAALQALLNILENDRYELVRLRIIKIVKKINDLSVSESLKRVSEQDRFVLVRNRAKKALRQRQRNLEATH